MTYGHYATLGFTHFQPFSGWFETAQSRTVLELQVYSNIGGTHDTMGRQDNFSETIYFSARELRKLCSRETPKGGSSAKTTFYGNHFAAVH